MAYNIDYLIVAGGGGGGSARTPAGGESGGGGGGGGLLTDTGVGIELGTHPVVVGAGGAGKNDQTSGGDGGNSSAFEITSIGGGGGSAGDYSGIVGRNGGCGGGAGGQEGSATISGGTGSQGGDGGDSQWSRAGGGGGGAGENGQDGPYQTNATGGEGGDGTESSITGSAVDYAGGGGGASWASNNVAVGGAGGGGDGGSQLVAGVNGTDGLGGGGGGGSTQNGGPTVTGGDGGDGVVIIRYLTSDFGTCTGGDKTTDGDYTVHTFTSNGDFVAVTAATTRTITAKAAIKIVDITKTITAKAKLTSCYTRECVASLPNDTAQLATSYTSSDITDVSSDNDIYVDLEGVKFLVHQYKFTNDNNTNKIYTTINLKSNFSTISHTIYLQIYDFDGDVWETIDSDNSTAADTEFDLEALISVDISNYYSNNNSVVLRVYQEVS